MRIKDDFVLRQVADSWIVLALGEASVNFNKMLRLNESGVLLWKTMENGCNREEMVHALMKSYVVDEATAMKDVDRFITKLHQIGCVE